MIESFPILSSSVELAAEDFNRFSRSYGDILLKNIPTIKDVKFIFNSEGFDRFFNGSEYLPELKSMYESVSSGDLECGIHAQCLILPFIAEKGEKVMAILDRPDPLFRQKVSRDWLLETRAVIQNEFLLLKQVRVDAPTGLLNLSNMFYLLDTYSSTANLHLILIELPPKRSSFSRILIQSQRCTRLLLDFMQNDSALHYMGECTFALVLQGDSTSPNPEIEGALVTYLKRAGCHRVHVGSSSLSNKDHDQNVAPEGRRLLDEAWTALRHAAKRGPFSFCDYNLLAHPENHPLTPPDRNVVRRLGRLWATADEFCLVHFKSDNDVDSAKNIVPSVIDQGVIVESGDDILVYIEGVSVKEILAWAEDKIRLIGESQEATSISAGVGAYPYRDFKKTEITFNCHKALLHAAFFGHSSVTAFDAVTLNISGDIYFNEGDLAKAVKEYRRGLKCDERDVNLHNSLGVALVMMNKMTPAMRCFEKGLAIDSDNFMALYNLGLAEQSQGQKKKACSYLEKALLCYTDEEGGKELVEDLKLQLGILSSDLGKHEIAQAYLLPWFERNRKNRRAGRVHYYSGKDYYYLRDNRKAMEALQRALRFNEFDDRAMNLLGMIYFEESEGDDIALSLCLKSVELEPGNILYRLHLAKLQIHCGLFEKARENLRRCLKNKNYKIEAQVDMARSYVQEDQLPKAKNWYRKLVLQKNIRKEFLKEADKALGLSHQK